MVGRKKAVDVGAASIAGAGGREGGREG